MKINDATRALVHHAVAAAWDRDRVRLEQVLLAADPAALAAAERFARQVIACALRELWGEPLLEATLRAQAPQIVRAGRGWVPGLRDRQVADLLWASVSAPAEAAGALPPGGLWATTAHLLRLTADSRGWQEQLARVETKVANWPAARPAASATAMHPVGPVRPGAFVAPASGLIYY